MKSISLSTAWNTSPSPADKGTSQAGKLHLVLMRVEKFTVRALDPMMLKDVKAALEILGLATHRPSIWTRDTYIQGIPSKNRIIYWRVGPW